MLTDFQQLDLFPIPAFEILLNFLVALCCGFAISWLYRKTYHGPGYSTSFVNSMVLLTLITAMVIMIIGNNLARAFGLVGAMSIIRFRTAVKETFDIVFIFFALAAGLAAGAGSRLIAVFGTMIIGTIVFLLAKTQALNGSKREFLLQFSVVPNGKEPPEYVAVIDTHCREQRMVNVKSSEETDIMELTYYVRLKRPEDSHVFIDQLKTVHGVKHINLYYDEEQF